MKPRLFLFTAIIFALAIATVSSAQRRPEPAEKPITGDFKITIRTTTGGQPTQSTTMIKGRRERSETDPAGGGTDTSRVSITQCDLRRTIQINERARKYLIMPMDSDDASTPSSSVSGGPTGGPARAGGVVTMTANTIDTGERKEMFGFTARHLRRTMTSVSSPDACNQQQMKMDTDGWYINLEYGLNCASAGPAQMGRMAAASGCQDRYQYKHSGSTNPGYPLFETTTMYRPDGGAAFTMTREVIELARQPLDAALFDVPAGYTEAKSQQEMYSASMADTTAAPQPQSSQVSSESVESSMSGAPSMAATRKVRVGVIEFNNKTKSSVSTDSLREQLIATLKGDGIDTIPLNATSPSEAAIEAKAKGCSHILYTDITTLKAASAGKKFGGMLGRATGVESGGGKSEARFDFRLVPTGSNSPTIQTSASGKEDSQEASVSTAIQAEAQTVAAALPKM